MTEETRPLGCGLGYREELANDVWRHRAEIGFLEIISDTAFQDDQIEELERVASEFPIVCHSIGLSLGSVEPLDELYIAKLETALRRLRPRFFSDHLAVTCVEGIDLGHLSPVIFDDETIEIVVGKIVELQQRMQVPFLLENITYYFPMPSSSLPEWEVLSRIVSEADCGLLLDLNNLYVNARNHRYDPHDFLKRIPLERVEQVHLAGSTVQDGIVIDSHGHAIEEEVFDYLEFICRGASTPAVLIERDQNMPPFEELLRELNRARNIVNGGRRQA